MAHKSRRDHKIDGTKVGVKVIVEEEAIIIMAIVPLEAIDPLPDGIFKKWTEGFPKPTDPGGEATLLRSTADLLDLIATFK